MLKSDFVAVVLYNEMIIIVIQVKDVESLTVISVEFCCTVNSVCPALNVIS